MGGGECAQGLLLVIVFGRNRSVILRGLLSARALGTQGTIIRNMDDSMEPPPEGAGPLVTAWYNLYKVLAVVLG